jgi:hypothetical protein
MFAKVALFAHIQQTLFNVETIVRRATFSHDVALGSSSPFMTTGRRRSVYSRERKVLATRQNSTAHPADSCRARRVTPRMSWAKS